MLKRILTLLAACTLTVGCAQSTEQLGGKDSSALSTGDNEFFKNITVANETEIQSSELALKQTQNASVRGFAQHMIEDHRKAEESVSTVASEKGVVLPTHVDDTHQALIDDLKNKTGGDFDKAYIAMQIKAHEETISQDEDEANNGSDAQVKALANTLLPTLKMHLEMAKQLQSGMGGM